MENNKKNEKGKAAAHENAHRKIPLNGIRICIDESMPDLKGSVYSRMSRDPVRFENCSEMFLRTDELFDEVGYPQNFLEKRSFGEIKTKTNHYTVPQAVMESEDIECFQGKCATFDVVVCSRRRAGWQGVLLGTENGEGKFHSELELLGTICRRLG